MMNGYGRTSIEQGRLFLRQAFEELERDDLAQASEKGWGAAAQLVKAYAIERGLNHDSHALPYRAVRRIVEETDDLSFHPLFNAAGSLHTNFYECENNADQVRQDLDQVTVFVDKVEGLLNGA